MAGCGPASHNFRPHSGVLYCKLCGDVRPLAPVEVSHAYRYEGPQTPDALPAPVVATPHVEDLERSVQDLEADVLERLRDGLGSGESWSSIMQRAGIDPSSDFARSMSAKVGAQQAAFEFDPKPAPLGFRASVTGLPPDEQALIEESNRHEQRRVTISDEALNAGL